VDRRESFQIWKVAVNLLNEQLQTHKKVWPFSLEVRQRANCFHHKRPACYEVILGSVRLLSLMIDSFKKEID
jgi:hypothetical protein